jgi:calcium-dependent protein kinase
VNEKRINDPKLAARIITHAKKQLSIRISTVKRERGFMYCQVKRKMDGSGGDIDAVGESNITTTTKTARKRGSVVSITGLFQHGLRFITTSVDGTVAEDGLVRVSHIDPDGLFGSSQNSNLHTGCIVLTVNGLPVTNGRVTLDKVMSSRNLVEILHCDERVWRDMWVRDGLTQVMSSVIDMKSPFVWDLEWQTDNEEVIVRNVRTERQSYAFRLVFNSTIGVCHAGLVDEFTMMPPPEEFDVPLLVQIVNHSQRTMMTMLMNMLHNSNSDNIESFPGSSSGLSTLPTLNGVSHPTDTVMEEMVKDEHGVVDKDLVLLAKSLMREDSRGSFGNGELRHSQVPPQSKAKLNIQQRRGSEGYSQMIDGMSSVEIVDQWRAERTNYENQPYDKRLREFAARQHKMDDFVASSDAGRLSTASGFSLFSNGLDIVAEDLEAETNNHNNDSMSKASVSIHVEELSLSSPLSPRDNNLAQSTETIENDQQHQSATEKTESDRAFVTGIFRNVTSKYEISGRIVGSGGFGEVRECYDKKTRKIYVVKSILKPDISDSTRVNLIRNEILLLHEANHENIVELRDLFEDDKFVHIVMERCTGGDLFDRVVSENPRQIQSHAEAVKYEIRMADAMRSILKVLKYLHSKDIVHRDIKPEHFLLSTDERETQKIKLIDFGLARKHKRGAAPMKTFTGSPSFVAPEVIARRYDRMCDMFSVGVTAFFLLTGMLPFDGPTDDETFELISIGKFKFPSSQFLSNEAKDFITNLLMVDPKKRMSAEKALNHPWLLNGTASC